MSRLDEIERNGMPVLVTCSGKPITIVLGCQEQAEVVLKGVSAAMAVAAERGERHKFDAARDVIAQFIEQAESIEEWAGEA
jgi:hypothetical protein